MLLKFLERRNARCRLPSKAIPSHLRQILLSQRKTQRSLSKWTWLRTTIFSLGQKLFVGILPQLQNQTSKSNHEEGHPHLLKDLGGVYGKERLSHHQKAQEIRVLRRLLWSTLPLQLPSLFWQLDLCIQQAPARTVGRKIPMLISPRSGPWNL